MDSLIKRLLIISGVALLTAAIVFILTMLEVIGMVIGMVIILSILFIYTLLILPLL